MMAKEQVKNVLKSVQLMCEVFSRYLSDYALEAYVKLLCTLPYEHVINVCNDALRWEKFPTVHELEKEIGRRKKVDLIPSSRQLEKVMGGTNKIIPPACVMYLYYNGITNLKEADSVGLISLRAEYQIKNGRAPLSDEELICYFRLEYPRERVDLQMQL